MPSKGSRYRAVAWRAASPFGQLGESNRRQGSSGESGHGSFASGSQAGSPDSGARFCPFDLKRPARSIEHESALLATFHQTGILRTVR